MSDRPPLRAVLFDIDGTLIDSNDLHVTAWAQAFRESGHPIADAAIHSQIGKGGDNLVPTLLPDADDAMQAAIEERHGEIFAEDCLPLARPFHNATALLRRVHADGRKVVLASSAKQSELDHYVDLLDVRDLLAATTSIDDVDHSKPEPDIFAAALRKVGVEPANALVVGDTIWDVTAAKRIGVGTIALLSGGVPPRDLEKAGAIALYENVSRLLTFYDRSRLADISP